MWGVGLPLSRVFCHMSVYVVCMVSVSAVGVVLAMCVCVCGDGAVYGVCGGMA